MSAFPESDRKRRQAPRRFGPRADIGCPPITSPLNNSRPLPVCRFDPLDCLVPGWEEALRRREFIMTLGCAVAAWPRAVRAQQSALPVIGFLRTTSFANTLELVTAFRQGLKEAGFVEGQNVAIEFASAEDHADRLPALVTDLIHRPVAVIVGNSISLRTGAIRSRPASSPASIGQVATSRALSFSMTC